jgi:SpoVK/Ycf46/Vps4 family AAA+-type ATPase
MSALIYAEYERALQRAGQLASQGRPAAEAYRQAARMMTQYAACTTAPRARAARLARAQAHLEQAAHAATTPPARPAETAPVAEPDFQDWATALIYRSPVSWDDIGGLEETQRAIKAAYGLTLARKPQGVSLQGWRNLLFYGPPGTGKTLLAAATSNGLEATFFNVVVSQLLSKYFGESSRLISALYRAARSRAPAVIFLDEAEALALPRGEGESGAERRMLSTLLAWLMDTAMLSRFEQKIYIPLPDAAARRAILRIQLERQGYQTQLGYDELVQRTPGYSGRELERLCRAAIHHMVERANPDLVGIVEQGRQAVEAYQMRIEPLTEDDFGPALAQVTPEIGPDQLARFDRWRQEMSGPAAGLIADR